MFMSWALRLAREFGEVFYHNPAWKTLSPNSRDLWLGNGFNEITMLRHFWDAKDQMDCFVFPTVNDGDWQNELVRQGKRVWGSRKGEELELYRPEAKEEFKRLGMPVDHYDVVIGVTALGEYIKKHPSVFVKGGPCRGDFETFFAPSYEEILPRLRELSWRFDDISELMPFCCERPIDPALEIGGDMHNVDGVWPRYAVNGVEQKDCGYCGVFLPYGKLDEHVRAVNDWLSPAFARYKYRGWFSSEIRVGPDEKPRLIDATCRAPSPPSESMQEIITNWGEIIWYGAEGVMVDPEPAAKYCAQAVIYCDHADEEFMTIKIPDDVRDRVKLYFHAQVKNRNKVIPQPAKFSQIGWVVGLGKTLSEANEDCIDVGEQISGDKVEVRTDSLEKIVSSIREGEAMGVHFSDEAINA